MHRKITTDDLVRSEAKPPRRGRLTTYNPVYAVILVGGKGKRLKPLSTESRPKAFLSVTKDRKTMFRKTVERILKFACMDEILVVANEAHAHLVRDDVPSIRRENLLLEPASRNTAPAVAFAAIELKRRCSDAVMVVLPSDHYITGDKEFLDAVKRGIDLACRTKNAIVTIGLEPDSPVTVFGYIKIRKKRKEHRKQSTEYRNKMIFEVERFVEKPDLKTAKRLIRDKRYLWNTGIFIFRAETILGAFSVFAPEIFTALSGVSDARAVYKRLPDISIDYAIMEKADNIYCVKGSYKWKDVGSFESLKEILKRESRSFIERRGKLVKIV